MAADQLEQCRIDPMLDGRAVTWDEFVQAHAADELTLIQLHHHWLNLPQWQAWTTSNSWTTSNAWAA